MRPPDLDPYFTPLIALKGVGERTRDLLAKVAGTRVKDLLFTPPTGVIDRRAQPGISEGRADEIGTFVVTIGRHHPPGASNRPYRVSAYDKTGEMKLVFFKAREAQMRRSLPEGARMVVSGKTDVFNAELQMTHPDYVLPLERAGELPELEPLYPLTAGLGQKTIRNAMERALARATALPDWQDPAFLAKRSWPGFHAALTAIHRPEHSADIRTEAPPRARLAYDELFAKQLALALVRESTRKARGRTHDARGEFVQDVLDDAPYPPTAAQTRVLDEIRTDLASPDRMARLLQGDVGAGKTFVAALAAALVCESGAQVAVMAPTEILARQHLKSFRDFLTPAGLTVEAMTGRDKGGARRALRGGLAEGYIDVVVGTHALFQDGVEFHDLGLVIIDEQHRFGVHDRLKLSQKGRAPDLMVMTATPIPRTLALTAYGDLDVSILDEKPAGRIAIETRVLPMQRLDDVTDGVARTLDRGDQVYWVCPLVEDSEVVDLTSAEERFKHLRARFGERVCLLHGRMKPEEKDAISQAFKRGEHQIMVATTVIEVGVDAPNATVIIIEHAERFGLAQLHQLRGRVGRSDKPSTCLLLYKGPLGVTGKTRLETMRTSEDGFFLAEKDWELRGSGDLLGAKQSGLPNYRLADLDKHKSLLETAQQDARLLVQRDPALQSERGRAARILLYLFEQDVGVALMGAG